MEKVKVDFIPLVSIIIPVYNGSNYMREAIDSALAQTYKNIEVIVVNDGSTDSTEEIAKSYGDKIRYFTKENGGVATALNLAIKNAKGEYISWLSHDDIYYPEKIEKQIGRLAEIEENDRMNTIMWSNYSLINEKTEITHRQQFEKMHSRDKLDYPLYGVLNGLVHGCTLLVPKHCFDDVGYFDEKLKTTQDYDLWFRMFPKYEVIFMSDLFVKSRWHTEQGSKKITTATQEADVLWIKMVDSLTTDQMISLSGSQISFYQKTAVLMEGAGYLGAKKYLLSKIDDFKNRDISAVEVSVIIPFFNRIDWTIQALKSVMRQTHKNIEIILVNDHSTEDIGRIEAFLKNDSRIRLLTNKRSKGVSGARNTGIDEASGEYIAFLDSDDLFLPEKISEQLGFMMLNDILLSFTSYSVFFTNREDEIAKNVGGRKLAYPEIISDCFVATPTVMVHADIFRNKSNRFSEEFSIGEDVCLWIKLAEEFLFIGLDKILTRVRQHGSNAAFDNTKQIKGIENILDYTIRGFVNEKTIEYIRALNRDLVKKGGADKSELINQQYQQFFFESDNLQISDNDIVGNKFNGHDLHFYLKSRGISSKQLVWNKESRDEDTFEIARNRINRDEIYNQAQFVQKIYSLDGTLNPLGYDIISDPLFLNTKTVHLHLIHNHIFDIQLLPLMSRIKPVVWTLHDPWALGGHCIHHFDCNKWQHQCGDCPNLRAHFRLEVDKSTLNFLLKKEAVQSSNLEVVVASKWMQQKVLRSPIFQGKNIHVIPFGINHDIFKPADKSEARKRLGIPTDALVILIRSDKSGFKGMDFIEYTLKNIKTKKNVVLLVLKDELKCARKTFLIKEYGWVKDDNLLAKIYSAADFFLMPSAVESFGMMAVEAMSCGTIPIVLDGTALPETVNAPECGVSTKRDRDEYLKVVQYFIDHPKERNERSGRCLAFARKNYNKDVYLERLIEVYNYAARRHELSEESLVLLSQLKKQVVINSAICGKNDDEKKVIIRKDVDYLMMLLFKYKNFFPKSIRTIVRKKIFSKHSLNILNEYEKSTNNNIFPGKRMEGLFVKFISFVVSPIFMTHGDGKKNTGTNFKENRN